MALSLNALYGFGSYKNNPRVCFMIRLVAILNSFPETFATSGNGVY